MNSFQAALELMPGKYRSELQKLSDKHPEELRLRCGREPAASYGGREHALRLPPVDESDLRLILERATEGSLYRAAEAMRQGYYCCGPLRIGVCGAVTANRAGGGYRCFTSLAIRLSDEHRGVCEKAARELYQSGFYNTLLLSPPGGGKTTALRDIIRLLSDGGTRLGVVDERGELSDRVFSLGRCTDVISGTDKLSGAMLLLRSMNPQIIAMDEISAPQDTEAVRKIFGCGTGLLATAHAASVEDLARREIYRELLTEQVFTRTLTIYNDGGVRRYEVGRLGA